MKEGLSFFEAAADLPTSKKGASFMNKMFHRGGRGGSS